MPETHVCLELFLTWLNQAHDRNFRLDKRQGAGATAADGPIRLAIEVRPLLGPTEDRAWLAARDRLQDQTAAVVPGAYALWLPAGADLAVAEPATSVFVDHVRQAAVKLGPHERSYVPLPSTLYLRKSSDEGGVVSVTGGLNAYWARFTEYVRGTYDLDSSQLHRLPESDEHLQELIDCIVERTKQLALRQWAEIETVDAWTIQRLNGKEGVTIVGVPPFETGDAGLAVRRNFRRILAEAGPKLRETPADARALVVLGYYPRMDQEGATTAMRGYDPTLYADIDFVCLVADGLVKPLIQAPTGLLPWARGRT